MQKNIGKRHWKTNKSSCFGSGNQYDKSYGSTWGSGKGKTTGYTKTTGAARGYNQIYDTFETRYRSYRMLWDQTRGTCKGNRPSPATLKTFANWINKGANVWKVTNTQINKWCHTKQTFKSCATAKTALCGKFGKGTIKAITWNKTGGYLVATAPIYQGKPFKFPY